MVNEIQFLDWENLFVNDIAGGETVFIALSFVLIMFLSAQLRLPNSVTIAIMMVYSILLSTFFGNLLTLVMLVLGIFFALALNRIIETT
jgi:hypothetical protein